MQQAMLHDGTREELLAYLHLQDADESISIDDLAVRVDPATWGTVAHTYVRLTADRALPLALQDRFVAEADAATPDNPFDVRSLAASHAGAQVHPAALVTLLDSLTPG